MLEDSSPVFGSYIEFRKIVEFNYEPVELMYMEDHADALFVDLDYEIADNLEWDSTGEFDEKIDSPYDQEMDWDFPDSPEFLS